MSDEFEKYESMLLDMLNMFDMVEEEMDYMNKQNDELRGLKNDVNHILELANLNAVQLVKIASVYSEKLNKRREVIDNRKYIRVIYNLFNKYEDFIKDTNKALQELRKQKREHSKRKYYARSEFGQQLIDQFSKESDDLVKSVTKDDLQKLQECFN